MEETPMRILTAIAAVAALTAGANFALAQQATGTDKPFCITGAQTSKAGEQECRFDTMAQCEAAMKGISTAKCGPNPKTGQMKK
jgi:predicted outer membrane protein